MYVSRNRAKRPGLRVWVMARSPTISDAHWARLVDVVQKAGYDTAKLRRVPQRWGATPDISPNERTALAQ